MTAAFTMAGMDEDSLHMAAMFDKVFSPEAESAKTTAGSIRFVPTESVEELDENWQVYRRPAVDDSAFRQLRESIAEHGILSPLEVSADGYVISGHRRLAAAKAVGLAFVPVIERADICMDDMTAAERVTFLTERNMGQRIKSDSELMLEAACRVDADEAIRRAEAARAEVLNKSKSCAEEVFAVGRVNRFDPQDSRAEMLEAVLEILRSFRADMGPLPMTERQIHYALLPRRVRTSTSKAGYIYGTRKGSVKLLSRLLTDARSLGIVPADWIDDPERRVCTFETTGFGEYVGSELDTLFRGYFSDVHAEQQFHVELCVEKNGIFPLMEKHVANKYRLPLTAMKGYGSFPPARDIARRFRESGKRELVVIYISDLDPEGVDMPAAFKKYLRHDFGVDCTVLRAAVTPEQVKKYNLPPDAEVKGGNSQSKGSSRAAGFIAKHGHECWELDSMSPRALFAEVEAVIADVLDLDIFNAAMERERKADIKLARLNAAVCEFVRTTGSKLLEGEDE